MKLGKYVLGVTGGTGDPWAVGWYGGLTDQGQHVVMDDEGNLIGGCGYRSVRKVSYDRGDWLLAHAKEVEQSCRPWSYILRLPLDP